MAVKYTKEKGLTPKKHVISQPVEKTKVDKSNRSFVAVGKPIVKNFVNVSGGAMDCAAVANCIDTDPVVQTSITNYIDANYTFLTCADLLIGVCRENIEDIIGASLTGGTQTGITVTYDDPTGTIDFVVSAIPATLIVQDEGVNQCIDADTINFTGAGVTATCVLGVATINIPGSVTPFYQTIQDEGIAVTQRAIFNFLGTSVTAVDNVTKTDITIQAYNTIQDEGVSLIQRDTIDFVGAGVVVTDTGSKTQVEINPFGYGIFQEFTTIPIALPADTGTGLTVGPYITITETGTYLITLNVSFSVSDPANANYVRMNVNINGIIGNDIFPDNYGIDQNLGIQEFIAGTGFVNLLAGDQLFWRYAFQTNAGGACTFTLDGSVGKSAVTIGAIRIA